jgi:hypothetical protein
VRAPTLLLVGGADVLGLDLNRRAHDDLRTEKQLEVIPDATHHFHGPGELALVAELAGQWFLRRLGAPRWDGPSNDTPADDARP